MDRPSGNLKLLIGCALGTCLGATLVMVLYETGESRPAARKEVAEVQSEAQASRPRVGPAVPTPRDPSPDKKALGDRIKELEAELQRIEDGNELFVEEPHREMPRKYRAYGLTQDELVELARNCEVRTEFPLPLRRKDAARLGLSTNEIVAYQVAFERVQEQSRTERELIWREAFDQDMPDLPEREVYERVRGTGEDPTITKRFAEERAGLRKPPPVEKMSLWERWRRLDLSAGDRLERAIGDEIGNERARELRSKDYGWPGTRSASVACPSSDSKGT